VLLIGIAIARAQSSAGREDVSIRRVDPNAVTEPFPVIASTGPIQKGGLYELSFTSPMYVPGLGNRQRLFVEVRQIIRDGWLQVEYGDTIKDKGATNAEIDPPVILPDNGVPPTSALLTIHYTAIAAMSPALNASSPQARFWPE
jgi:hypothetical protein